MTRRRILLRRIAPAALAGVLGLGTGLVLSPGGTGPSREATAIADPPVAGGSVAPSLPARPGRGRVPVGAVGPTVAATAHLRALVDERLFGAPQRRRALAARIATAGYREELARRLDSVYRTLEAGRHDGGPVVLRACPLGYRLEHREPAQATVAVWSAVVYLGGDGAPAVSWTLSRAAMQRAASGWHLSRYLPDEPGPAPASSAPATPAGQFATTVATLMPYRR